MTIGRASWRMQITVAALSSMIDMPAQCHLDTTDTSESDRGDLASISLSISLPRDRSSTNIFQSRLVTRGYTALTRLGFSAKHEQLSIMMF